MIQGYFDTKGLVSQSVRASQVMVAALIETMQREKEQQPLQEALSLCKRAALQAHRHNLQELVYKSQYLLGRIAILQDNPVKAAKHFRAAIIQVERILQDLVYDLSPSFLRSAWAVYADMITICLQQGQGERAFGLLLTVVVTAVALSDPAGALLLLRRLGGGCKKLRRIWVDGTYRRLLLE